MYIEHYKNDIYIRYNKNRLFQNYIIDVHITHRIQIIGYVSY